ncbi:MAG: RIP metalloprotease RseP [Planctomycetes bacterium]|nr:RIP metalloprotease RseP [Planctomycetota bacterium]
MTEFLSTSQGIIMVLLGLGIIIFLHELGHFIVARRAGIRIEVFSIGFGPPLWKITRGGTEYRIALIPLGGFVKPAGEFMSSPDTKGAPDEMSSKPPLTRAKVLVAGALMNFIFAFPFCIIAYLIGVTLMSPSVGAIRPGSSEANSSLQKGDIIRSVIKTSPEGRDSEYPVKSQNDYLRNIVRTPINTPLKLKVNRNGQEVIVDIIARGSTGMGVLPPSNIVESVSQGSPAETAGLKPNDEILEVNCEVTLSASEISAAISQRAGLPTAIKIRTPNGEIKTVTATPKPFYDIGIEGIIPVVISGVTKDGPAAKAGLKKGDRITVINTEPLKFWNKFTDVVTTSAGKELKLTVIREHWFSKDETLLMNVMVDADKGGKGFIGISGGFTNEIGEVKDGSALAGLGLAYGDRIVQAKAQDKNGRQVKTGISDLSDLQAFVHKTGGVPIEITVLKAAPTSTRQTFTLTPTPTAKGDLGLGLKFKRVVTRYSLVSAVVEGANETLDLGLLTYQMIRKLFQGEESVKGLAGPIGIIQVSYRMAQEGAGDFLWLLALISINLAILNLLPIPVLDGGTIVFCFVERIKGSPVSIKAQAIAQYAGLFILLLLVAFTFFNDIQRILNL